MKNILFLLPLLFTTGLHPSEADLDQFISPQDKRHHTFKAALALMEERNAKILVETGTARYGLKHCPDDGCSTPLFAHWASLHDAFLYSVDINPEAIAASAEAVCLYENSVSLITGNSILFLEHFHQRIDFLYLDSKDFEISNPTDSQEHHLQEIVAAYPFLSENSIVMIDDCDLPFGGKGLLVIDFLLSQGWHILVEGYQVILSR